MININNGNRSNIKNIHLIGIGGISMSGIAEILLHWGYNVSGSDMQASNIVSKLSSKGAKCFIGHSSQNVETADLIIYTAAVKEDNPEIISAKELNIPLMDRATALGQIMEKYQYPIAISGTHGKTTTTGIISLLLEYAKLSPTILIGGELDAIGGNVKIGQEKYFVTEACEYVETFLKLRPYLGIILNIEEDHLDYFRDLDHIKEAFRKFTNLIPEDGYLVVNGDDENISPILEHCQGKVVTFGIEKECTYMAVNLGRNNNGNTTFDLMYNNEKVASITLSVPGTHNVYNSLAAIASAHSLGVDFDTIAQNISLYTGTHRRFELKGVKRDIIVIDDYAHHPTEIKATLSAAQQYNAKNIWAIFQPHTYTRTKTLLKDFSTAFNKEVNTIITDIYAARELDKGEIHSKDLVELINQNGSKAIYIKDFDEIVNFIKENAQPGDMVLTIGAGDVYKIGESLLDSLS